MLNNNQFSRLIPNTGKSSKSVNYGVPDISS